MKSARVFFILLLLLQPAHAARWVAHPDKSRLSFTALQQGAEFTGVFQKFSASFEFDPADPDGGSMSAIIRSGSATTGDATRDDYLAREEWFHTELWPDATYICERFSRISNDAYVADGVLTLRGVSKVVPLNFTLLIDDLGENAVLIGSAELNRLDFGVGQGSYQDTSMVGNPVTINMELQLLRSFE